MNKKIKNQTKAAKQTNIAKGKIKGPQASASRGKQIVASVNL